MEYRELVDSVRELDFVPDESTADAAVKAVLGVLASVMDESGARHLTDQLPEPLTMETLRGHQANPPITRPENYFDLIADRFNLDTDQASAVVQRVLHKTKASLSDETVRELEEHLPAGWSDLLDAA